MSAPLERRCPKPLRCLLRRNCLQADCNAKFLKESALSWLHATAVAGPPWHHEHAPALRMPQESGLSYAGTVDKDHLRALIRILSNTSSSADRPMNASLPLSQQISNASDHHTLPEARACTSSVVISASDAPICVFTSSTTTR